MKRVDDRVVLYEGVYYFGWFGTLNYLRSNLERSFILMDDEVKEEKIMEKSLKVYP